MSLTDKNDMKNKINQTRRHLINLRARGFCCSRPALSRRGTATERRGYICAAIYEMASRMIGSLALIAAMNLWLTIGQLPAAEPGVDANGSAIGAVSERTAVGLPLNAETAIDCGAVYSTGSTKKLRIYS